MLWTSFIRWVFAAGIATYAQAQPLTVATKTSIFTGVAAKLIRPNTVYKVTIGVEPSAKTPMTFDLSLNTVLEPELNEDYFMLGAEGVQNKAQRIANVVATTEKVTISPGNSGSIVLKLGELPESRYNLTLTAEGENGDVKYADYNLVYKDTKEQSILIQSDKPIYKPGETVNLRVVMLNRFLRPLKPQPLEVQVLDPQQNVIKFWKQEKVPRGIFSTKFELSPETNLGNWQLKAKVNGQEYFQTFTVDQYVLPKFKVDVILPPFITFNNTQFTAEVKAAYTYGKPMKGECEIKLSQYQPWRMGKRVMPQVQVVNKKQPIDGSAFFEFNIQAELEGTALNYENEYELFATVTDALTGRQQNGTSRIRAYKYPYKIEMIEHDRNYKPGFPLTLTFKVVTQDGKPIGDENPLAFKLEHSFSFLVNDGVTYSSIPANGIVKISIDTPSNEMYTPNTALKATYKDLTQTFFAPARFNSPSKTYIDIRLDTKNPEVNSQVTVTVRMNKEFSSFTYVLYGRGQVLGIQRFTVKAPLTSHKFKVTVPSGAAPEATLLVYTVIQPTFEIAVDSIKFTVTSVFENFLDLTLSKDVAEPGETVKIAMYTTAGSTIAVRGVDQSVLLLKEDRDITVQTIENEVKSYKNELDKSRLWGGDLTFQTFEEAGLIVLTNANFQKPKSVRPRPIKFAFREDRIWMKMAAVKKGMVAESAVALLKDDLPAPSPGNSGMDVRVRKDFPETWLWHEIQTNLSRYNLEKIVPDTMTAWIITGYSLSPDTGIGVTLNPSTLKTFRPFFITLNKPYSVVKGELFGVQVLVHNYMQTQVTAAVTLQNSDAAFEFFEGNKALPFLTKNLVVPGTQVKSLTFVIKLIKFGNIKLDVKAVCSTAGDALSEILIVKPPGQKQSRNKAVLLDLRKQNSVKQTLTAEFPPTRVEGADIVKISVISDLLVPTLNNLDKLLQMPCGCGEQNMLNFVPDIVILEYLKASGTLTEEIKAKAIRFLESGYQRELTYKRADGSFSAFGASDPNGSTWLTAFVARSFIAAKHHITIDPKVIVSALKFLATQQQADGSFIEHGRVIHADMKGAATDSYSLSAYVLLAFIESKSANITNPVPIEPGMPTENVIFDATITKGIAYISSAPTTMPNPYPLTLITYALQAAKSEKKASFHEALEKLAKTEGDLIYWEPPKLDTPKEDSKMYQWEPQTKPISVEMTAYSVLLYLNDNNLMKALPSGKWLLGQRNAVGGFISTQDTVVGLTALGKFSLATRSTELGMTIKAASNTFQIKKDNAMVLQEAFLPATTDEVTFEAEGKGTALVQLTWSYYVEDKSASPVFSISVKIDSAEEKQIKLKICTTYVSSDGKKAESNMAVMEINLPSGYGFDRGDLEPLRQVERVKRFELEDVDTKLNIYFDSLDSKERCLDVEAGRIFKVANPAASFVSIYDYYDTTRRARAFYAPPGVSACQVCAAEQSCGSQNCV